MPLQQARKQYGITGSGNDSTTPRVPDPIRSASSEVGACQLAKSEYAGPNSACQLQMGVAPLQCPSWGRMPYTEGVVSGGIPERRSVHFEASTLHVSKQSAPAGSKLTGRKVYTV